MASDSSSVPAVVRSLSERLAEARPMRRGSLSERYMKCSKPGCACQRNADGRHGPYYSLTRNIGGQTQSRLVAAEQVERVREQIAAGRQFRQQVEAFWGACEHWADAEAESELEAGAEKRGSRRRSRPRSRPKSKR